MRYGPKSNHPVPGAKVAAILSSNANGEVLPPVADTPAELFAPEITSDARITWRMLAVVMLITLAIGLLVTMTGCAGTPTADRVARFATEYCDLDAFTRGLLRTETNAIFESEAAKRTCKDSNGETIKCEPLYICVDCPGTGDECIDRSNGTAPK